jgi:hypothetical protein
MSIFHNNNNNNNNPNNPNPWTNFQVRSYVIWRLPASQVRQALHSEPCELLSACDKRQQRPSDKPSSSPIPPAPPAVFSYQQPINRSFTTGCASTPHIHNSFPAYYFDSDSDSDSDSISFHLNRNHEGRTLRRSFAARLCERRRPQDAVEEDLSIRATGRRQHRHSCQAPRPEVHGHPSSATRGGDVQGYRYPR